MRDFIAFALQLVFNNIYGLCLLHDLVGTSTNRNCEEHVGVHWIIRYRWVVLHERMEIQLLLGAGRSIY